MAAGQRTVTPRGGALPDLDSLRPIVRNSAAEPADVCRSTFESADRVASPRRPRLARGLLTVLGVAALLPLAGCRERPRPSHVLLVSIDSLRADHLGAYGYPKETSPHIDALAREGTLFERAVSSTSWTLPAHVALLSGVADSAHGVVDDEFALGSEPPTLAEELSAAGFATGAVVSGPYLHRGFGLDRGFDEYLSCMGFLDEEFNPRAEAPRSLRAMHEVSHGDVTNPCVLEKATAWLRRHREGPAFLFVHFWDVHYDYLAPEAYVKGFDADYGGELDASGFETNEAISPRMDPRDLEHLLALYDAEIAFTDEHVGRLLAVLAELGIAETTLVVLTSDHGEAFFEHGAKGHRKDLHAEVVRIPLVFRGPGVPRSRRLPGPAHITDVAPTILELVRGEPVRGDGPARGVSLVPAFAAPEALAGRWVASELEAGSLDQLAVESLAWKVMLDRRTRSVRAYDLARDPEERTPLPAAPELLARLDAQRQELGRASEAAAPLPLGGPPPEVEERLRALGYID